jgi:transposase
VETAVEAFQLAELKSRGFKVKLISPQFVKPYLKSLKNDVNDAEAICEAMTRHHMRFVAVKTVAQQDIQAIHRVREGLMNHRKAKANQIRGLVAEYGLVAPRSDSVLARGCRERSATTLPCIAARSLGGSAAHG